MAKKQDGGALAKRPGTALMNIEQELRNQANIARATEESVQTGQFFGTKGGILTFNGAPIKDNKMEVVVVDHILANIFYVGKFNPNDPTPPVCYAFGRNDKELVPHEKSSDKQAEKCSTCEQNEFGTADTGRGKACKNSRRLACISAALLEKPEQLSDAPVAYLGVPVTSVKGWAGYVRQVADTFGVPPLGVVTEVSLVADSKDQFKMVFRCVERVTDKKALQALLEKQRVVGKEIAFPFPEIDEEERAARAKPKGKGGGVRGQAAAPAKGAARGSATGGFGARPKHAAR